MDREVVDLYLDDIIPNRFQPREVFDEKALEELSISIKEHGVIQPIIVRKIGDKYEIIAGERRYKASALAGLTKIPAIIRNLDDRETSKVALLENLQRKDLTAIEEARTYQKILELDTMTQEELGKTMGKSQPAIANKLRLLDLPDEVQEALLHNQISERHARSLLSLSNIEDQISMLDKIIKNRMTVREVDDEIKSRMLKEIGENQPVQEETPVVTQDIPVIMPNNDVVNLTASSEINLDEIKNKSTDIIRPVNKVVNLDDLLRTNIPEKQEEQEEDKYKYVEPSIPTLPTFPEEKKDTYDANLLMPSMPVTENHLPIEELNELEEETEIPVQTNNSMKDTINIFRDAAAKAKANGFVVNLEEMDFENTYQIIIKIDKNN